MTNLCGAIDGQDFENIDNSKLAYGESDDADNCGQYRLISLADDSGTAPRDFPGIPILALNDPDTGALTGWLSFQDGQLVRLGANDKVQGDGLAKASESPGVLGSLPSAVVFLNIDGQLYAYDSQADKLTDLGYQFTEPASLGGVPEPVSSAADADNLYFLDNGALHRTDIAAGTTQILEQSGDGSDTSPVISAGGRLQVGSDRVVWSVNREDASGTGGLTTELRSVDKDDGSGAKVLDTLSAGTAIDTTAFTGFNAGTGRYVFYTRSTCPR